MDKQKKGDSGGDLKKGVSFTEGASQKGTSTHQDKGTQRPKKGTDRI